MMVSLHKNVKTILSKTILYNCLLLLKSPICVDSKKFYDIKYRFESQAHHLPYF